jgi:alkanesulfonate monooxygenase SsuD/methylene tetrahydromethanopterin reductase-like flavin-dependent oxidoreductase (luciferase family)
MAEHSQARRYWGGISAYLGPRLPEAARQLEADGRFGLFAGQGSGPPWVPLAAAAAATERVLLGCSVAIAGARSPAETAFAALDLDRISGGRFVLGLGSSTRWMLRANFGVELARPLAQLRDSVAVVRHVARGAHRGLAPFEGDTFRAGFEGLAPQPPPVREEIPIWLGALRGPMTRLAGEVADGLIGHPLWNAEWWRTRVAEDLRAGARAAGRDAAAIHRCVYVAAAPDADEGAALADARRFTAAYAAIAEYAGFFEERGFGDAAARLRARWEAGDPEGAAALVGEEMASAFVAWGTPERVRAELERAWQVADSMLVSPPFWGLPPARIAHWAQAIRRHGLEECA